MQKKCKTEKSNFKSLQNLNNLQDFFVLPIQFLDFYALADFYLNFLIFLNLDPENRESLIGQEIAQIFIRPRDGLPEFADGRVFIFAIKHTDFHNFLSPGRFWAARAVRGP